MISNIWNVKQRKTKNPLPIFYVDLKPKANNKDIYNIKLLMNTCVQFEAPHAKREIPQCTRCQRYGHTKNYCYNNPRCVKCAENHLTSDCPRKTRDEEVRCVNCNEHHPANYRGCMIHKQLQQKIYPAMRERIKSPTKTTLQGATFAQVLKQHIQPTQTIPEVNQYNASVMTQPATELAELTQMMKKLMEQLGTMLNLLTTLITKIA